MAATDQSIRRLFLQAAEAAAAYREKVADLPQRPLRTYDDYRATADATTPIEGRPAEDVIAELVRFSEPGLAAMTGPRFFAWVVGASAPVGVAADWLATAWGQNTGNHHATPATAVAEEIAARWLLDILDLPRQSSVGFVTGATMASFVSLTAARSHVLRQAGWDIEADGLVGAPEVNVIIGDDAHTTVFLGLQMLGFGHRRLRRVATDDAGRMKAADFARVIAQCQGPTIAIAQAGQINTGAFDPIGEIADIAHAKAAWLHIDGAFGLWARACPEKAALTIGIEKADSWATDGHKWLQTPYDCGYAIVSRPEVHNRVMTAAASYLPAMAAGERDPSHLVPELSRHARGFATWAMLRHLGKNGIAAMVARHCRLARRMAEQLAREPGITVLNEIELNQVILRFGGDVATDVADALTEDVIARVQEDGVCFLGGARWRDQWVMRISVISGPTEEADADRSVAAIIDAWRRVRAAGG